MKFKKILALILVMIMSAAIFVGCGLFTKNSDKQLSLVVAKVTDTAGGVTYTEEITRRELIVYYYNNGGSDYTDQGSSIEDVLKAFLNQMVSRKIFFIEGKKAFAAATTDHSGTVYADYKDAEYLTTAELAEVELSVLYSNVEKINGFKDTILSSNYAKPETSGTKEEKKYNPAPTAKPEDPAKPPKEPKPWELPEEYFENVTNPTEKAEKRAALTEEVAAAALLSLYQNIEAEEYTQEEYQKRQMEAMIEQKIIEKYRDKVYEDIKNGTADGSITEVTIKELFDNMRKEQIEQFGLDPDAFFSKASSPADGDFLLFYPSFGTNFTYIAVKNLLIKFDDETTAALTRLKEYLYSDDPEYIRIRNELIENLIAKDRRDPYNIWDGTGSYEVFLLTDYLYKTFGGDDSYNGVSEFAANDFLTFILTELGCTPSDIANFLTDFSNGDASVISSSADYSDEVKTFVELIFAYGQDDGMFNNTNDYIVAPEPVMGGSETYVAEFAAAARDLTQAGQITYCVTDFGLHIMLCTEVIPVTSSGIGVELQFDYNDILNKNYDSVSYKFFNYVFTNKKESYINELQKTQREEYINSGKVKKYLENIEDLWK